MEYYIVIPAHNEEDFLGQCLQSILKQSLLPKKIVVVNDHSTDGTERLIDIFLAKNKAILKVNAASSTAHLPGSKVVNAFGKGLAKLDEDYDFLVKLDADLVLPEHYFERIGMIFKTHPAVGITGGLYMNGTGMGNGFATIPWTKTMSEVHSRLIPRPVLKRLEG